MATAPHRPSAGSPASTRVRRRHDWLRHPALAVLMLLALGAAPAAYLSSAGRHASARLAPGDTVAVYGPHQFNGSGGNGTTYVERFTVALVPGRQYLLRLDNGAVGGGNRATSAVTTLNGAQVVSTADLTTGIASVTKVVAVRQIDTLRVTVIGAAGSFVTATVSAAKTAEYALSGPTDYGVPSGTSKTYTFSFSKPASAGPPYRLYLTNGDSAGARRVTNASVVLNGTTVVTTSEFTKSVGSMTKAVTLVASNNVTIDLKGSALTFATLTFTATDTAAPVLTITAPADGAVTGTSPVTVTGTIGDQSPTGVTVNGVAATVVNNTSYSASVPLTTQGNNTLTVIATDAGGRSTQVTRTVVFDNQPPVLAVSSPADGSTTQATSVTVNATATDATALTVNTNGTPLTPGGGSSYSGSVSLAAGVNVLTTTASDAGGNVTSVVRTVTRDNTPPALAVTSPADGTNTSADSITVTGTASDATALTVTVNGIPAPVTSGSFTAKAGLTTGPNTIIVVATDAAANATTVTRSVSRELPIPPDPSTVATALDPTAISTVSASTAFLYSGSDPIQTGVAAGTIKALRAAVVRGRVVDTAGTALSGVQVTVLGHPEFGQTVSRLDGRYDMAVNGGGQLTLSFAKGGRLPAQRTLAVPWENYAEAADVALVPLDQQVTTIAFQQPAEVARGSVVTDAAGTRQATMVFEQGTNASMVLADGSTQPLTALHVRATEFTTGSQGPVAMPAPLPATSAYTYAVELSVDEALAVNARSVQFTAPVAVYVDNFLHFATGGRVPVGTYDRSGARWVPEKNARVIKILSTNPVQIAATYPDTTTPASQALLDSLGVSPAELTRLGSLYSVGATVWRAELSHFSTIDFNISFLWPDKAFAGKVSVRQPKLDCMSNKRQSIVGCEGQTLGEDIGVAGTPFSLHYQSDRTGAYDATRRIEIPAQTMVDTSLLTSTRGLRSNEFPSHVLSIRYSLQVAGKSVSLVRSPASVVPSATLQWDGRDSFGRVVNGPVKARLSVGFEYQNLYAVSISGSNSGPGFGAPADASSIVYQGRERGMLEQVWEGTLGDWDNAPGLGLGGWSLSAHHLYDPASGTVYLGSGERIAAAATGNVARIIPATEGTFCSAISCGTPVYRRYALGLIAVDASGRVIVPYLIDGVGPSSPGIIRFLGTAGTFVDSIPNAGQPRGVAVGPDGTLYYSEQEQHDVKRRAPDGTTTIFAGTSGAAGFLGDGGPATAARLNFPGALALGLDGSLFIADENNNRIRRVAPDGTISTYAGTGGTSLVNDGALATATTTPLVRGLAVAPDGTLIFGSNNLVRRIDGAGRVSTVAGYSLPNPPGPTPATSAFFSTSVVSVAVEPDGDVLFAFPARVYRATLAGTLETVAGIGASTIGTARCVALIQATVCDPREPAEQEFAPQTALEQVLSIAVAPDRTIYLAETSANTFKAFIRAIRPSQPGLAATNMLVAAPDGSEVYEFSTLGRHLRTRDGLSGKTLTVFDYDPSGRIVALRDSLGNTTTIERDGTGTPVAIVAPFGQRTTLTMAANGYLQEVRDPGGNRVQLVHSASGLLKELRDPRDKVHRFAYDGVGRLVADSAPNGSVLTLVQTARDTGYTVAVTTAMGRSTSYAVDILGNGTEFRTAADEAGLATKTYRTSSGVDSVRTPDGTRIITTRNGDPRLGPQVAFPGRLVVRLPSNDSSVIVSKRASIRSDSTNPFTLTQQIDSTTVNGQLWRTAFATATQVATTTSPEGRQTFTRVDSLGRTRSARVLGLDSVSYAYDARGRASQVRSGGRTWTYSYDGLGRLLSRLDPLGQRDSLFYDTADRLTRRVLPGGREVHFAYDSSGNLTGITPPGRPVHGFGYTVVDQTSGYTPPNVGLTTPGTTYSYNLDRQLTQITRPDSVAIAFGYDPSTGRPSTVTFDRGQVTMGYSPTTGQLTGLTAPGGATLGFTYDGMLPKTVNWGGPVTGSVGVGYDTDFRVTSQTVNGASSLNFGYDRDGLLTIAGALGIKRHAQHGLVDRDSLNTVKGGWTYTSRATLATYTATSGATTLFQTAYTRDSLDRVTGLTETIGGSTTTSAFTYDSAGRLFEVRRDGVLTATYEYDPNGNRSRLTMPGGVLIGTYDDQDRLTCYGTTTCVGSTTYTYGSSGELKTKTEPVVGTTSYTYDALGSLVAVTLPDGTALSYVIDGQNRRVGKRVNGTLVQGFLYQSQLAPVAELDGQNQVVSRFVYGTRANVPDYLVKGGVTYRIISDHLGSVRLVVNAADGTVAQRIDYDEFGRVTQNTAPGLQPFGFAGGLLDSHTGLTRLGARDYDATVGRWTAKDPIGFSGGDTQLYGYVSGDPINMRDNTGLCGCAAALTKLAVNVLLDIPVVEGLRLGIGGVRYGAMLIREGTSLGERGLYERGGQGAIRLGQAWRAGGWNGVLETLTPSGFTAFGVGASLTLDGLLNGRVSPSDLLSEPVLGLVPFVGSALSLFDVATTCF